MSQGSLFDSVQDQLFTPAPRVSLREELGGSSPEQYAEWAARHAVGVLELPVAEVCTVPPAESGFSGDCRDLTFYRCRDCLSSCTSSSGARRCDCGGMLERVGTLRGRHVYSDRIACDTRCQGATQNTCTCACDGRNHGRTVYVEHDHGELKVSPTTPAKIAAAQEWRSARAGFLAEFHRVFPWRREGKRAPWEEYSRAEQAANELRAAGKLNSHKGRMRRLEAARVVMGAPSAVSS